MTGKPTYEELEQRVRELESADSDRRKALEASLEREKRLRSLFDGIPVALYRTGEDGRILEANQALAEMLGVPDPQWLLFQDSARFLVRPEEQSRQRSILVREGVLHDTEVEFRRQDGSTLWVRDSARVFQGPDGQAFFEGSLEDITERKQAEEALNDERSFLSAVLDNIEEAIVTCDREGRLLRFNEAARRLHGLPEQPIPPDQWADYYDLYRMDGTTPLPTEEIPLFRALKGERVQSAEIVVAPKREDARTMVCSGQALTGDAGEVVGAVVAMHDITERKQIEESLRQSEARYSTFINSSNDLVFIKDEEFRYIVANKALADFLDKTPDAVIGLSDFELMPTSMAENCRASDKQAIDTDSVTVIEEPVGDSVFETVKFPVPLKSGRTGVGGFIRDITDRKQAEEEIGQRNSELAALNAIGAMVNQSLDLEIVLESSLKKTMSVLNVEGGLIYLFDETSGTFSPVSHQGISPDMLRDLTGFRLGEGLSGRVAETGKPLVTALDEDAGNVSLTSIREGFRCYAGVPMTSRDKMLGVMSLITRQENALKPQHLSLLGQIGNQVGVAIENAYLYDQAQRDIAKRKQAEEALRESEALLSHSQQMASMGSFVWDLRNDARFWSKNMYAVHGVDEEASGGNLSEVSRQLIHPDDRGRVQYEIQKMIEAGHSWSMEFRIVRPDGEERIMRSNGEFELDDSGKPVKAFGIHQDITESKRVDEKLRLQSLVLNQIQDRVTVTDLDGVITYVNDADSRALGYSRDELIGASTQKFGEDPEKGATQRKILEETLKHGTWRGEVVNRTVEGEDIVMDCRTQAVLDKQGNKVALVKVATDITERKRAEKERGKLQARLAQAQKMEAIGTLAGGIAHDFNNILSIIVGNAELAMLDVPEWSPAQDNLKEVREATLRARELVKQILLFARQKEHTLSHIRLEPIAKESLKMLRASIPTTVEIREDIEEDLPSVLADPSQVQQIIMNLCTNAGQVMEAEGGTLTVRLDRAVLEAPLPTLVDVLSPGRYVRMQVTDMGPGIPPEIVERIFDPFFTTKGVGEGTGLGLAVVHGIVQDRSGGITVESEGGRGTTFTVYLPASDAESVEAKTEQTRELPRGTERILFVDDEPMIIKLGQRMLEKQGYIVQTRASGTDALECFRQDPQRFDLVVTDMTMPGMRGDRLAEEIMAIRPDIPVILSTGYSKQISNEKAREMGIRAFVMKPLTKHELANTLREVLDERPPK
jgi:PAS domain S-box-containing protein